MVGLRYQVISWERKGRIWFHVVDSWAPLGEQPAVEYSFLTRAASDNAARELNKVWEASQQRRSEPPSAPQRRPN
jgi:hypothetical protein